MAVPFQIPRMKLGSLPDLPEGRDAWKTNYCKSSHNYNSRLDVAPGQLFSATGKYRHCLRFNFIDSTQTARTEAIKRLGDMLLAQEI